MLDLIERMFCRLKDFRRIATRYDDLHWRYFPPLFDVRRSVPCGRLYSERMLARGSTGRHRALPYSHAQGEVPRALHCRVQHRNELARGFCSSLGCALANPEQPDAIRQFCFLASRYGATHAD
jgi:hypothetical protein